MQYKHTWNTKRMFATHKGKRIHNHTQNAHTIANKQPTIMKTKHTCNIHTHVIRNATLQLTAAYVTQPHAKRAYKHKRTHKQTTDNKTHMQSTHMCNLKGNLANCKGKQLRNYTQNKHARTNKRTNHTLNTFMQSTHIVTRSTTLNRKHDHTQNKHTSTPEQPQNTKAKPTCKQYTHDTRNATLQERQTHTQSHE